jgi:hypothetical protein
MGEMNSVSREYLSSPERFAEVFNAAVFRGRCLIRAEDLVGLDAAEVFRPGDDAVRPGLDGGGKSSGRGEAWESYRDILKMYKNEAILLILGIENQEEIHFAMPLRHMLYDAANYQAQWRKLKRMHREARDLRSSAEFLSGLSSSDRLLPVITLCIYWGSEPWNGPKKLHDLLDIPEDLAQYKSMIGDYPLNLLEVCKIEDLDLYSGELKALLGFVRYQKEKEKLFSFVDKNKSLFESLSPETTHAISVLGNVHELGKYVKKCEYEDDDRDKKEGINVCQALQEMMQDMRSEGRLEGHEAGMREGREAGMLEGGILTLIEDNLENGLSKERILEKLQRRFQLSCEDAEMYFRKFGKIR